ncbi:uncharacterized protein LOC107871878 [Capsicum annuum]|uniref:uncharacterized protein LOC107871878 n=1 Tax=Capsicum annuum TaxID=4072 RepID=UPI0007BEBA0B|nr:uncharacterized protein LOC107871878 [Capsicum annuum]
MSAAVNQRYPGTLPSNIVVNPRNDSQCHAITTRSGKVTTAPPALTTNEWKKALEQMPGFTKFMKDLITKKRLVSCEPVDNIYHCCDVVTRSLVEKKDNLGTFTIPCTIKSFNFIRALCDLGASINLMALAVFKQLGLGAPEPTTMRLVKVNRIVKKSVGILYNVLQPNKLRVVSMIDVDDEEANSFNNVNVVALSDCGSDVVVPV